MRITIVGLGLIGGSLGLALRRLEGVEVTGVARRAETAERALARGAAHAAGTDITAVAGADLVVVAVPLAATAAVLEALAPHLDEGTRVTDVGSTKEGVVRHAESVLDTERNPFLGGHPMAGREVTGIEHAGPDLFAGRAWIFTPDDGGEPDGWAHYIGKIRAIGAAPLFLTPRRHDRLVAMISHIPFLLSSAYLLAAARDAHWPEAAGLASSGFRDITRLGAGDSDMYAAIAAGNREAILDAWGELQLALEEVEAAITRGEGDELHQLLAEARAAREAWAKSHPGAARA